MPIVYDTYQRDEFDLTLEPMDAASRGPGHTYGGLSPFGLPNRVEVEITGPDECVFRFGYADRESAARRTQRVPGSPWIEVVLGRDTKRILELHLHDAERHLREGSTSFDSRLAYLWFRNATERVLNSARRNAGVVAKIMETLPPGFRQAILDQLLRARSTRKGWSVAHLFGRR